MPSVANQAGQQVRRAAVEGPRLNVVAVFLFLVCAVTGTATTFLTVSPWPVVAGVLLGVLLMQSPKVAKQWERAIVLRLGRYVGLRGPGLFWVTPFVESVSSWVDQRVITT